MRFLFNFYSPYSSVSGDASGQFAIMDNFEKVLFTIYLYY